MRLMDRIGTLIKADAHGVVESMEDRRLLTKQLLRDAKLALDDKRAHLARLRSEQQRLGLERERLGATMARIDQDVALAVERGDDELARAAIRKLLPLRDAERRLDGHRLALREEEARSNERLALQEREFEVLKARVQAELALADARAVEDGLERQVVTEHDVELELLRRRQSVERGAQ